MTPFRPGVSVIQSIEFHAIVEDGAIKIPSEHLPLLHGGVTVTVVPDDRPAVAPNLIDNFLAMPLRVAGFQPLSRDESHAR